MLALTANFKFHKMRQQKYFLVLDKPKHSQPVILKFRFVFKILPYIIASTVNENQTKLIAETNLEWEYSSERDVVS